MKKALEARLEAAESKCARYAATILNTEGWVRSNDESEDDDEFADNCVSELFQQFEDPLKNAGLNGTLGVLLVDLHLRTKADLYSFMQGSFVKLQDLIGYVSKYMLNAT